MKHYLFVLLALATIGNNGFALDPECTSTPFAEATGYNLFVLNQLQASDTSVHGRVAVAGSANVKNYSVGQKLVPSQAYAFVVGNSLTARHGSVYGGPLAVGGTFYTDETFSVKQGAYQGRPVDFAKATTHLWKLSRQWAGRRAEGKTVVTPGTITFTGQVDGTNSFTVSADELSRATFMKFEVPTRGTVLVNVTGDSVKWHGYGFDLGVLRADNIVFNFAQANKLDMNRLAVPGTVLAPFAEVVFNEARIDGELIAYSVIGNGHMDVAAFAGCLPGDRKSVV